MSEEQRQLQIVESKEKDVVAGFGSRDGFELLQRMAKMLAASDLVPKEFRGNIANCVIGLEMASRMNASPLAVLQNLYIVHGKPSWSAQFITAALNSTGKFSPLRFRVEGTGDQKCVTAWAAEKATGEILEGPPVTIAMAKAEGWFAKNGSKWQTMPDLMLRYRAATFFGRLYAPEVLMGMQTVEEILDIVDVEPVTMQNGSVAEKTESKKEQIKEKLRSKKKENENQIPLEIPMETYEPPELAPGECPNSPGDTMAVQVCEECSSRDGCPVW